MKKFIKNHKRIILLGSVIFLGLVGLALSFLMSPTEQKVEYKESLVKKMDLAVSIDIDGQIKADVAPLNFKSNSIVTEILVKPGDKVIKGQILAKIDDRLAQQQVKQATYNYYKAIYERNKIDQYSQPESYSSAQQQVNIVYVQLEIAKLGLEDLVIKAPFDGVVIETNIFAGSSSQPGANLNAIEVLSPNSYYIESYLEESEVQKITVGTKSNIDFESDEITVGTMNGEVSFISPIATYDNNGFATYFVRVNLVNAPLDKIREGYSVEVRLLIKEVKDVIVVPVTSVFKEDKKTYVLKKDNVGNQEKVEVSLGFTNNTFVEVLSGVSVGDIVYNK